MSKASVEQALSGLVPALNGPLPPELLELALSFLARSRSVASSLKPDEEIARPYACAQLACERLKKRLNLPTITSRPPCAPRIYKKLYAYLTSALLPPSTTTPNQPQTPRKNRDAATNSTQNTPSRTPASGRRTPKSTRGGAHTFEEAPEWVMPAIRSLVKAFEYPAAAPHIYTGVETILPLLARTTAAAGVETPSKRSRGSDSRRNEITDTQILGLIAVVFLYVFARMKDVDVSEKHYAVWSERAVRMLCETAVGETTSSEEMLLVMEALMPMVHEEGWLDMEWFSNILPEGSGEAVQGVETTEGDQPGASAVAVKGMGKGMGGGGSEYIGLATMMQDATDYLGERQRDNYQQWKSRILERAREIESTT